MVNNIYPSTM